jgi:hypothetical protein
MAQQLGHTSGCSQQGVCRGQLLLLVCALHPTLYDLEQAI